MSNSRDALSSFTPPAEVGTALSEESASQATVDRPAGAFNGRPTPGAPLDVGDERNDRRRQLVAILVRAIQLGPVLVLALFWLVLAFASPYFFTSVNLSNLLLAAAIPGVLALGQLNVILTGAIDLSSAAVYVLTAVIGVKFANHVTDNPVATVAVMLGLGTLIGVLNGALIEYARIGSSLVVTLGTLSICTGAAYVITDGSTQVGVPSFIGDVGGGYVGQIPVAVLVLAGIAVIASLATSRLRWGRWVYALGSNREAATRVGIPVRAMSVSVFAVSGLMAAVAGIFAAGLTGAAAPGVSFNSALDAIAAVIIGGTALTGGRGTVWGTIVGLLILQTIHNALALLGASSNWEPIILGTVLLGAVAMEHARSNLEIRLRLTEARLAGDL